MKAVLEISGFDVDTAASARDGKARLRKGEYHMIITDLRMESEAAGAEVIQEARAAKYHPAVALLTAFPVEEDAWQEMGADKMLVKPMHTRILLRQIEQLFASHEAKLAKLLKSSSNGAPTLTPAKKSTRARSAPAAKITPTQSTPKRAAVAKAKETESGSSLAKKITAKKALAEKS